MSVFFFLNMNRGHFKVKMSNGGSGCSEDGFDLNEGKSYLLVTYFKSDSVSVILDLDFRQLPRCKLAPPPTVSETSIPQRVTV